MELQTTISLQDLKILIKDLISEFMLEYSATNKNSRSDLFTYSQVFERFFIKPEKLDEWAAAGLITEYKAGNTVRFKISELFKAIEEMAKSITQHKVEKEVSLEHS